MKILVVDDEQLMGKLLLRTLQRLGHEPVLALHPGDALQMLDSAIEAVITDIDMPDMNGVELARAIKQLDADMPIAFCTGSDPGEPIAGEAAEIGRVLPKVFTESQLRAVLCELARQRMAAGSGSHPTRSTVAARRATRFRVHLPVRYTTAGVTLSGFAENISAGGLFIRDAEDLDVDTAIDIDVDLPCGFSFRVSGTVVYCLDEGTAELLDRRAGAGVALGETPPGFTEALDGYLGRLQRRKDHVVFAADEHCRRLIAEAGYQVRPLPPPTRMAEAIAASRDPIAGVIVARREESHYAGACSGVDRVIGLDYLEELGDALAEIDRVLS